MEYFVIGERELILGFMLAGVKGKAVSNRQEALDAFNKATGQNSSVGSVGDIPKVLILTEDIAPLIVEIPGLQGHIQGRKTLTDSIREAVGIQV